MKILYYDRMNVPEGIDVNPIEDGPFPDCSQMGGWGDGGNKGPSL